VKASDVVPIHLADVTYPEFHPLAGEDGIVLAFAIRHPEGLVLVDTGIGEGDAWVDEHYRPRVRDVGEALRGAALEPADVRTIVHTHLHFDHCGQDRAFRGVPIVVQRAEREAANVAGHTVPGLVGFPGARYELVDGDSEIAPGVSVLATPGHTVGHQSVVVDTTTMQPASDVLASPATLSIAEQALAALASTDPARARRLQVVGAHEVAA